MASGIIVRHACRRNLTPMQPTQVSGSSQGHTPISVERSSLQAQQSRIRRRWTGKAGGKAEGKAAGKAGDGERRAAPPPPPPSRDVRLALIRCALMQVCCTAPHRLRLRRTLGNSISPPARRHAPWFAARAGESLGLGRRCRPGPRNRPWGLGRMDWGLESVGFLQNPPGSALKGLLKKDPAMTSGN